MVRNGKQLEMSVFDLLVGDVLFVGYGDILPVDGILLEGSSSIRHASADASNKPK